MTIERQAFLMALGAHQHQRYGDHPYIVHLFDVVEVLRDFKFSNPTLEAAAWLHDVIEDTDLTYADVNRATNVKVAEIVLAVTDEVGRNRQERKAKTHPKLVGFRDAQIVKLADWIANCRDAKANRPDLVQMYRKDFAAFDDAIRTESTGQTELMWKEIQRLLDFAGRLPRPDEAAERDRMARGLSKIECGF